MTKTTKSVKFPMFTAISDGSNKNFYPNLASIPQQLKALVISPSSGRVLLSKPSSVSFKKGDLIVMYRADGGYVPNPIF